MSKKSAAHQAVVDCYQHEQREKLAYHFVLSAIVAGTGKWGSLQRVGSAYDRGDSWVWQLTFSPRMRDAVIMETFTSKRNDGPVVRCFFLDDCRSQYEGRSFSSDNEMAKLQQLYFRAKEMWNVELNRAA